MADPVWPTYPWHLLLISWDEPSPGFIIEHAHRLAAYGAGLLRDRAGGRPVVRRRRGGWRWSALACVVAQGLLGGVRVLLNAPAGPELAAVHGVFGQLVFSLLVCLAVLTAPRPNDGVSESGIRAGAAGGPRWSWPAVVFLQLVLGGGGPAPVQPLRRASARPDGLRRVGRGRLAVANGMGTSRPAAACWVGRWS